MAFESCILVTGATDKYIKKALCTLQIYRPTDQLIDFKKYSKYKNKVKLITWYVKISKGVAGSASNDVSATSCCLNVTYSSTRTGRGSRKWCHACIIHKQQFRMCHDNTFIVPSQSPTTPKLHIFVTILSCCSNIAYVWRHIYLHRISMARKTVSVCYSKRQPL